MLSKKLLTWAALQAKRLQRFHGIKNQRELLLAHTVKLMEESGELADAVLATSSLQRKDKASVTEKDGLAFECADVILTTLIIAERAGVDINVALKKKTTKITERFEKILSDK
jgi:NTP pyrophosphatase (non-canonical NTP hydrolase)